MGDDEFRAQLAQEEEEARLKRASAELGSNATYTDPNDGTTYEWIAEKNAWFPKITDDFLAAYHANYGQSSSNPTNQNEKVETKEEELEDASQTKSMTGEKRKAASEQQPPGWFEVTDEHNTNVYVSNLPSDVTEDEFVELMSKCGIIMKDPETGKLKMKLYKDETGSLKGDARCCYIKVESVDLALKILDGSQLRDKVIRVERAKFQLKGEYDPSKKPRKKKSKDKKKIQKMQEKLLDWRPERAEGARFKCEKTVIIKNMFNPKEFEEDATLILEYQDDLREECSKFGQVKKVQIYDRHPEGVASVTFQEAEMADGCIATLNGRWFAGRQLEAHAYDGRTKYAIQESEAEREERMKQWETFLDQKEAPKATKQQPTPSTPT